MFYNNGMTDGSKYYNINEHKDMSRVCNFTVNSNDNSFWLSAYWFLDNTFGSTVSNHLKLNFYMSVCSFVLIHLVIRKADIIGPANESDSSQSQPNRVVPMENFIRRQALILITATEHIWAQPRPQCSPYSHNHQVLHGGQTMIQWLIKVLIPVQALCTIAEVSHTQWRGHWANLEWAWFIQSATNLVTNLSAWSIIGEVLSLTREYSVCVCVSSLCIHMCTGSVSAL